MSAQEEDRFDNILNDVASKITDHRKIESLGTALGFSIPEVTRYLETNMRGQSVTYNGTLQMLRDWRETTSPNNQRDILKTALEQADLIHIANCI